MGTVVVCQRYLNHERHARVSAFCTPIGSPHYVVVIIGIANSSHICVGCSCNSRGYLGPWPRCKWVCGGIYVISNTRRTSAGIIPVKYCISIHCIFLYPEIINWLRCPLCRIICRDHIEICTAIFCILGCEGIVRCCVFPYYALICTGCCGIWHYRVVRFCCLTTVFYPIDYHRVSTGHCPCGICPYQFHFVSSSHYISAKVNIPCLPCTCAVPLVEAVGGRQGQTPSIVILQFVVGWVPCTGRCNPEEVVATGWLRHQFPELCQIWWLSTGGKRQVSINRRVFHPVVIFVGYVPVSVGVPYPVDYQFISIRSVLLVSYRWVISRYCQDISSISVVCQVCRVFYTICPSGHFKTVRCCTAIYGG